MLRDKSHKISFNYKFNFGTFYKINFFLSFIEKKMIGKLILNGVEWDFFEIFNISQST